MTGKQEHGALTTDREVTEGNHDGNGRAGNILSINSIRDESWRRGHPTHISYFIHSFFFFILFIFFYIHNSSNSSSSKVAK